MSHHKRVVLVRRRAAAHRVQQDLSRLSLELTQLGTPLADILVVNKGDRPGAELTLQQLIGALSLRAGMAGRVPVLKTTATTGEGVPELVAAIAATGHKAEAEGPVVRRRRRARYLIARAASDLIAARVRSGGPRALDALADQVLAGDLAPEAAAEKLLKA